LSRNIFPKVLTS